MSSQITFDNLKFSTHDVLCFAIVLCFDASFFSHGFGLLFFIFSFEVGFLFVCMGIIFRVWRGYIIKMISIIYDVCV